MYLALSRTLDEEFQRVDCSFVVVCSTDVKTYKNIDNKHSSTKLTSQKNQTKNETK